MDWTGWYCIAILVVGVGVMARDIVGPDVAMLGMLTLMMIPGEAVMTVQAALAGFSNSGVLTVAILFVMAAGISETGGLDYAFSQLLGTPSSTREAIIRVIIPVAVISAFLNNTPVVAVMIPIIIAWCRKANLNPTHLFMPLSFASILGGTITLIGTSTNLVVAGKQKEAFPEDEPIGIFGLSIYGVPVALMGMVYIVAFGPVLLPGKEKKSQSEPQSLEDAFLVGLEVNSGSPAIGKSVEEAGMRGLQGLYLTSVRRGQSVLHAVGPEFMIAENDVLFFAGDIGKAKGLAMNCRLTVVADAFEEDLPALLAVPEQQLQRSAPAKSSGGGSLVSSFAQRMSLERDKEGDADALLSPLQRMSARSPRAESSLRSLHPLTFSRLFQARVKHNSPDLLNVTIRDAQFRSKFQASIVSVRRAGEKLNGRLGDVELHGGDELVFDAGAGFDATCSMATNNLENVGPVVDSAENEFMFAFQVQGGGVTSESHANLPTDGSENGMAPSTATPASAPSSGDRAARPSFFQLPMRRNRIVGRTIEAAGLRGLPDVFLVAIEREGTTMHAVSPQEELRAGDILWFAGSTAGVISLRKIPGLSQVGDQVEKLSSHVLQRRLVQVVVSKNSELIGKTVRETRFRSQFDAAIVALNRSGQRIRQQTADIVFAAGDVLLLDTGEQFIQKHRSNRNFALVAEVDNSRPPRLDRVVVALVCAIAAIVAYVVMKVELFTAASLASAVMLLCGCLSVDAARKSVNWEVIVTIAAAFGISNAMESTGAARAIANLLVSAGTNLGGQLATEIAVYVATVLLSNIVANNAAAALMYPVAANVAKAQGMDEELMSYLLMLAASASFAVPFGYQTNLMVYGAGGYKFGDFVRFGGPMQIWQGIVSVAVIALADYVLFVWVATAGTAVLVFAGPILLRCYERLRQKGHRQKRANSVEQHSNGLQAPPSMRSRDVQLSHLSQRSRLATDGVDDVDIV